MTYSSFDANTDEANQAYPAYATFTAAFPGNPAACLLCTNHYYRATDLTPSQCLPSN